MSGDILRLQIIENLSFQTGFNVFFIVCVLNPFFGTLKIPDCLSGIIT